MVHCFVPIPGTQCYTQQLLWKGQKTIRLWVVKIEKNHIRIMNLFSLLDQCIFETSKRPAHRLWLVGKMSQAYKTEVVILLFLAIAVHSDFPIVLRNIPISWVAFMLWTQASESQQNLCTENVACGPNLCLISNLTQHDSHHSYSAFQDKAITFLKYESCWEQNSQNENIETLGSINKETQVFSSKAHKATLLTRVKH